MLVFVLVFVELPEFLTDPPWPPAPPFAVAVALPPVALEVELELLFDWELDWEEAELFELELF